jgi:hypothetical protein
LKLDCAWRDCPDPATVELRFDHQGRSRRHAGGFQGLGTYVRYCLTHAAEVERLFHTRDRRELDPQHRQGGLSRQAA